MPNLFQNSTKQLPKSDPQIIRVDMEQQDIGGRKSHMPSQMKNDDLSIKHVPGMGVPGNGR